MWRLMEKIYPGRISREDIYQFIDDHAIVFKDDVSDQVII